MQPILRAVRTSGVLLAASVLAAVPARGQVVSSTAITGVTVIDVERGARIPDQTVVVTGARIAVVGPRSRVAVPAGAAVVDGRGRFLIPGLWDMHTHSLDRWDWTFPLHVAFGVTGIRDLATSVPLPDLLRVRADVEAGRVLGPRFVAAGPLMDGPGSSHPYLTVRTAGEARAAVDSLGDAGADFIKIYDRLPLEALTAVFESARRRRLPVVGHVPEALTDPADALTGEMRSIEHASHLHLSCATDRAEILRSLMRSDTVRALGDTAAADRMLRDAGARRFASYSRTACERQGRTMREVGTWLTPTLTLLASQQPPVHVPADRLFAREEYRYMPRETLEAWRRRYAAARADTSRARREQRRVERAQTFAAVRDAHRGGARLLAGTDGSASFQVYGVNLHEELALLVEAGLTPREALEAATLEPARFLNRESDHGSVVAGKVADLIVLDADPLVNIRNTRRIHAVVLDGRLLQRRALDSLLAGVAALHRGAK